MSSITPQSDSRNSSSTTPSVTSSASGGWNIAYALAAVPATIAESDLSQTLDYSKMNDGIAALVATDSSGHRSSGEEQQSDDEETIIKEQLEIVIAKKAAADMKAQGLELRFKLKQKLRSNASQSSRGSNDRSRSRLYGLPETATTELFNVFTPLQTSLEMSNASTPVLPSPKKNAINPATLRSSVKPTESPVTLRSLREPVVTATLTPLFTRIVHQAARRTDDHQRYLYLSPLVDPVLHPLSMSLSLRGTKSNGSEVKETEDQPSATTSLTTLTEML